MHAERLPCTVRLLSLVLIALAIFLLEGGHTEMHTVRDTTDHLTEALATTGVDKVTALSYKLQLSAAVLNQEFLSSWSKFGDLWDI